MCLKTRFFLCVLAESGYNLTVFYIKNNSNCKESLHFDHAVEIQGAFFKNVFEVSFAFFNNYFFHFLKINEGFFFLLKWHRIGHHFFRTPMAKELPRIPLIYNMFDFLKL